ncbi:MAG: ribosome-binding factor A [Ardenticatenales bacterium]|nr:ribosome-binding factor A [Ardenticatenales bacterium]
MATLRQRRINERLFEELSLLIPGPADEDDTLADVVVTRVETTQDLATAKVYFRAPTEDEAEIQAIIVALKAAEFGLRAELADVGLRRLPHLVFAFDRAFIAGKRVLDLLDHLSEDPEWTGEGDDPGDKAP